MGELRRDERQRELAGETEPASRRVGLSSNRGRTFERS